MFPNEDFDLVVDDERLEVTTKNLIRKLSYRRGSLTCFSDLDFVLDRVPTETERIHLIRALSRIPALMVRLSVGQDTDIDKMVSYWTAVPGVRSMDVRPLLESVKRLEGGGTVNLLHLLPPFARERLFTFPLHSSFGEAGMDCHWSTMNFCTEAPDNRFTDPAYTSAFVATNCYSIAKPSQYGDLIFLIDASGKAIHSAVYIADDVVFTKNGSGYTQPWLLMRLKDVAASYSGGGEPRFAYYRNKST